MKSYTIKVSPGEALYLWRARMGLTITNFARTLGLANYTLTDIEKSATLPDKHIRERLESVTGIPAASWNSTTSTAIQPGEYLMLLLRRRGVQHKTFCGAAGINTTRFSQIISGQIRPTAMEQDAIAAEEPKLNGAWR